MKRKRFTDEQIAMALRQTEGGTPVADVCCVMRTATRSPFVCALTHGWRRQCRVLRVTRLS